jgi:cold shock CspA family protein
MRIDGTLVKWNEERGYGFIAPQQGGPEVFAHIKAFPRDGRKPQVAEALSFEIGFDQQGRKRAKAIQRLPERVAPARPAFAPAPRRNPTHWVLLAALLIALGGYGYRSYSRQVHAYPEVLETQDSAAPVVSAPPTAAVAAPAAAARSASPAVSRPPVEARQQDAAFHCDGRTHCSQMTSCAEATYFLNHCPGVEMDGNHDGVPCERQWCGQ